MLEVRYLGSRIGAVDPLLSLVHRQSMFALAAIAVFHNQQSNVNFKRHNRHLNKQCSHSSLGLQALVTRLGTRPAVQAASRVEAGQSKVVIAQITPKIESNQSFVDSSKPLIPTPKGDLS